MGLLLFVVIAASFWMLVRFVPLPDSPGLLLATQIGLALVLLLGPILTYAAAATALTRRAVTRVAEAWCAQRQTLLEGVEMHKNHFSVVYREDEQKRRAKFRVKFVPTTWLVKEVTWL